MRFYKINLISDTKKYKERIFKQYHNKILKDETLSFRRINMLSSFVDKGFYIYDVTEDDFEELKKIHSSGTNNIEACLLAVKYITFYDDILNNEVNKKVANEIIYSRIEDRELVEFKDLPANYIKSLRIILDTLNDKEKENAYLKIMSEKKETFKHLIKVKRHFNDETLFLKMFIESYIYNYNDRFLELFDNNKHFFIDNSVSPYLVTFLKDKTELFVNELFKADKSVGGINKYLIKVVKE